MELHNQTELINCLYYCVTIPNADIAPNNMVLMGDITWVPFPGLSLYLQVGFDDINLNTLGTPDSTIPTIDAEIVGVSYSVEVEPAWSLALSAEGGHTHYLWGNFSYRTPLDDYLSRAIYRMDLWSTVRAVPLTSPYGPGSWWLSVMARLSAPWGGTASISASYVLKNPLADLQTTPYAESELIENSPLERHVNLALDVEYRLGKSFRAAFSPEIRFNPSSIWLSLALGVSITLNSPSPATPVDVRSAP